MKRMYQIGLIASLSALLPMGLFAGNGDGNGDGKGTKNTISVANTNQTDHITVLIATPSNTNLADLQVNVKNGLGQLHRINVVPTGIEIGIDVTHSGSSTGNGDDGTIIIEIVGVDNITGVDATDDNNGTTVPTSLTGENKQNGSTDPVSNDPTGFTSNGNGSGGTLNSFGNTGQAARDDIKVYPNPVRSETNVVTVGEILGKTIQVIDLSGTVVLTSIVPTGSRQTVLDLSTLTPGIYIINYFTEDGKMISKKIQKI